MIFFNVKQEGKRIELGGGQCHPFTFATPKDLPMCLGKDQPLRVLFARFLKNPMDYNLI